MNQGVSTSAHLCLAIAGVSVIGWCCLRAWRRGDNVVGVVFRGLFSLALVFGLVIFIGRKLEHLSGDVAADAVSILTIVAAVAVGGVLLSVFWAPAIADLVAAPLSSIFDGGHEPPEVKPAYSAARFQRDAARPDKALAAVRGQLDKFPNDYEGVMLQAEIQAVDMDDLSSAKTTLENFINAPETPPRQAVAARMKLVNWHLGREEIDSARQELKQIAAQFPETEFSLHAEQQLAQLNNPDPFSDGQAALDSKIAPGKLAAVYVKHLQQYPEDTTVREKLAMIYARDFKRLDLATMEFEQLIHGSGHSRKQTAQWLHRLANTQIELGADLKSAQATLQRIAVEFADQPEAKIARQRLARLKG